MGMQASERALIKAWGLSAGDNADKFFDNADKFFVEYSKTQAAILQMIT